MGAVVVDVVDDMLGRAASGGFSSAGLSCPEVDPDIDGRAECELSEFIVLDRVSSGASELLECTDVIVVLGLRSLFAASCRSALSFFRSSLVCSPGQSGGTFISHLLWHV